GHVPSRRWSPPPLRWSSASHGTGSPPVSLTDDGTKEDCSGACVHGHDQRVMALTPRDEATVEPVPDAEEERARREALRMYGDDDRIPLPEDPRTTLLAGILLLMVFYTLYFAREIVMPILFAFLLNLLLQPAMRFFDKLRIPSVISAALVILLLFGSFTALFSSLVGPA